MSLKSFYLLALTAIACATPVVEIDQGVLDGRLEDGVVQFLGVPYAQPPVGELRWRAPRDPLPWTGARDAKSYGNVCFGRDAAPNIPLARDSPPESEDCLTINLSMHERFFKSFQSNPNVEKQAVNVFLYGGRFDNGHSADEQYEGRHYLRSLKSENYDQSHIFVTLNYRVGPMGFLTNKDDVDPETGAIGNYGALDVIKALEWVQKNIHHFGGDASRVTLGGHSAGAILANSLQTSPLAKGLFSQIYLMSGSAHSLPFDSIQQSQKRTYENWLEQTGCSDMACLKNVGAKELFDIYLADPFRSTLLTVDNYVFTENPQKLIENGEYEKVPMFNGNVEDEGTIFILDGFQSTKEYFLFYVRAALGGRQYSDEELLDIYNPDTFGSYEGAAIAAIADGTFKCAVRNVARNASKNVPVFVYNLQKTFGIFSLLFQSPDIGAFHGCDMFMVFQPMSYSWLVPFLEPSVKDLAHDFGKMLSAFVTLGNPTIGDFQKTVKKFPAYNEESGYKHLDLTTKWFSSDFKVSDPETYGVDCDFWDRVYASNY